MELREQLEKLIEKSLNKKDMKCPDCQESKHWKYAGSGEIEGKREPLYQCQDCQNTFYHRYLTFYNNSRNDD